MFSTALAVVVNAMPHIVAMQAIRVMSVPVSSSVVATILSTDDELILLVLWRGTKSEWYSAGPHRESGGEGDGKFSATLQYGHVLLELQFDSARSKAVVQGKEISMQSGANVLLVDEVDGPSGVNSVRALTIDAAGANLDARKGISSLADLLGRSPDVISFLRCSETSERGFTTSPCHELMKR